MPSQSKVLFDSAELWAEAKEARYLASTLKDRATVSDLLSYAAALERDAARWETLHKTPGVSLVEYFTSWWNDFALPGQR